MLKCFKLCREYRNVYLHDLESNFSFSEPSYESSLDYYKESLPIEKHISAQVERHLNVEDTHKDIVLPALDCLYEDFGLNFPDREPSQNQSLLSCYMYLDHLEELPFLHINLLPLDASLPLKRVTFNTISNALVC